MAVTDVSRKLQLFEIATDLFKRHGFSGTSMRDLASAMGIEAGSLYSHVDSKDEILQNICFSIANKFLGHIDQTQEMSNCSNGEKLDHAIQGHVRIISDDINAMSVFWNEWKYLTEPWLSDFSRMQLAYENKFRSILEAGVEDGEFCIDDITFTTMAMLSSLNGLQKWRTYSQSPEELGKSFAKLFITGIKN